MATELHSLGSSAEGDDRQIRLLIVDDSAVARAVLSRIIGTRAEFEIAAMVASADAALAFLASNSVDIILLDIEMPGMDGLTALPALLDTSKGARVLIVSSSCAQGAKATMHALTLGAADTLAKPVAGAFDGSFARMLAEKLMRIGRARLASPPITQVPGPFPVTLRPFLRGPVDCVAVGASTGGIHALSELLRALPPSFDAPILVTQHLPPVFMPFFARQVAALSNRPALVARHGDRLERGCILVAPGEGHIVCRTAKGSAHIRISDEPAESGCMPSVDPMLASVADVFGSSAIGVMLSGMGRDGLRGATALVDAGGVAIVQDRESSVVWGMPGAVASAGLACAVLPPARIAELILQRQASS